jgi:uncharacterized small protein (DUF1192 family)
MSASDEDKPAGKPAHELGSDLSMLSAHELASRIVLLRDEIARMEREIAAKSSSRNVAENLFRK